MNTYIGVLALLFCSAFPAAAAYTPQTYTPPTYVHIATFTPSGTTTPVRVAAFQNTSSDIDVYVQRIEVNNASTGTYAGGTMQFWVYASTVSTPGGITQVSGYKVDQANATLPTYISFSTGPVGVIYEGKQAGQLPLFRPLYINNDETATSLLTDSYSVELNDGAPIMLPRAANRALIFEQRRLGTTDIAAGTVMLRIYYTVR